MSLQVAMKIGHTLLIMVEMKASTFQWVVMEHILMTSSKLKVTETKVVCACVY